MESTPKQNSNETNNNNNNNNIRFSMTDFLLRPSHKRALNNLNEDDREFGINTICHLFLINGTKKPITNTQIINALEKRKNLKAAIIPLLNLASKLLAKTLGYQICQLLPNYDIRKEAIKNNQAIYLHYKKLPYDSCIDLFTTSRSQSKSLLANQQQVKDINIISNRKEYILTLLTEHIKSEKVYNHYEYAIYGLLYTILSFIQLKSGEITEEILWKSLNKLGLKQTHTEHHLFGNIKTLINTDFVNARYLERKRVDNKNDPNNDIYVYHWGARAIQEIKEIDLYHYNVKYIMKLNEQDQDTSKKISSLNLFRPYIYSNKITYINDPIQSNINFDDDDQLDLNLDDEHQSSSNKKRKYNHTIK